MPDANARRTDASSAAASGATGDPGELSEERLRALEDRLQSLESELDEGDREALDLLRGTRVTARTALGSIPPEEMLEPEELEVFESLRDVPEPTARTLPRQVSLILKATRYCNLRCTYCNSWRDTPNQRMTFEVLAHATHGVLSAPGLREASFLWHGGETTLMPVSFYRKAFWLQERFRKPGQGVRNAIQTNGTHLTEEWLDFIERFDLNVGVSLDGPPEVHDSRRVDIQGRGTSHRVREGLEKLLERGVDHRILMVVDDDVIELGARRMLDYLLSLDVQGVSLLNVVPDGKPSEASPDDPCLDYDKYVQYLRDLFDIWYPDHVDDLSVRELNDFLVQLQGGESGFCVYGPNCVGRFFTIEPQGGVSHCDKYQNDPDFRFGNILETPLPEIPRSPKLLRAHGYTEAGLDLCHSSCSWSDYCGGGCPHDRYVRVVRRRQARDERCCGLAPLLSDMAEALGLQGPGETPGSPLPLVGGGTGGA